jgi:hypothetical protein
MDADEVRNRILTQFGIRVDAETGAYVLRQLQQAGKALQGATIPVMGGHARTGIPIRQFLDLEKLGAGGEPA